MKWPLFENKIKKELSAHRSEVDVDALWNALEPQVDAINASKRKRRRGAWWLLLAGTLLLGSGLGLYFFSHNPSDNTVQDASSEMHIPDSNIETPTPSNLGTATENTSLKSPQTNTGSSDKPNGQEDAPSGKNNLKNSLQPPMATLGTLAKGLPPFSQNMRSDSETAQKMTSEAAQAAPNSQVDMLENRPLAIMPTPDWLPYPALPFLANDPLVPNLNIIEWPVAPTPTDEKRHPMDKDDFRLYLSANGGTGLAIRSLADPTGTAGSLLQLRSRTEDPLETVLLGIRTGIRHRSGLDFSTELQFARITERFEYRETITTIDTVPGIAFLFVNPNNDTIPVMGDVPLKTTTTIEKRYFNRYTLLDIPVLVGYFTEKGDWSLGAQAGVFANVSLKTSGRVLKNEKEDEDIKNLFRAKVGMSYYAELYAGRKLGDQLEIGVLPHFRYFAKNFAKEGNPISQQYWLIGVEGSVRCWF